jgi:hypothetical protein
VTLSAVNLWETDGMNATLTSDLTDDALRSRLNEYAVADRDHWAFRGKAVRQHAHIYFQYPAMMVPQMVGDLLDAIVRDDTERRHVFDPFSGSGTALTEAMMRGLDFTGQDINPLAVLLCQAKTIPFFDGALGEKSLKLLSSAKADRQNVFAVTFPNQAKWFRDDVSLQLSRIRRAIEREGSLWARRFFWIVLAETVRLTSNSRTSTFKLHIRPQKEIDARKLSPMAVFEHVLQRNLAQLTSQKQNLDQAGLLRNGRYCGAVNITINDSTIQITDPFVKPKFDIMVTSPPYGDNTTTVPYGQHSYLPLQWIELADISPRLDRSCLQSTHEIDKRSLGGSRRRVRSTEAELRERSAALGETLDDLKELPPDRAIRVLAFCRDLHRCIAPAMSLMKNNSIMIWILGNRKVGGKPVPLDRILGEFLVSEGARRITIINREIPTKRMAIRNSVTGTMRTENIVILRKGAK